YRPTTATSARVRAAHQLQGCFNVSPGFSLLRLTLLFAGASLLSGLNNCHLPMGLKQLSGIILDFDFSHPHDAVLLSFGKDLTNTGQHENSRVGYHLNLACRVGGVCACSTTIDPIAIMRPAASRSPGSG